MLIIISILSACRPGQEQGEPFPQISSPGATLDFPTPEVTVTTEPQPVPTDTPQPTATATLLPSEPFLGVHINDIPSQDLIGIFPQPELLWMRSNRIFWDQIEPQRTDPPTYDWSKIDEAALAETGASGMNPLMVVQFAPGWAQKFPPSACGPIAEEALQSFGQFMNALVSRYSQPPYNVHHWEIVNEPDVAREDVQPRSIYGCWAEKNDPYFGGGYYGEMLKAIYPQVKAVDPESQVLVGGLLLDCDPVNPPEREPGSGNFRNCTPAQFLEGILINGAGDYFDGISFHSYDFYLGETGKYANGNWHSSWETTGPVLIAKTRFLRDVLGKYGYDNKLLLNTELALICGRDGSEPECQTEEFELSKAYYIPQGALAGMAVGLEANTWYSLFGWRGSRLVTRELEASHAFRSFVRTTEQLDRAVFRGEVSDYPGVKGYEYERDGVLTWLLWSQDGADHAISLPTMPVSIQDVFGAELPANQDITISIAPVYIKMNP